MPWDSQLGLRLEMKLAQGLHSEPALESQLVIQLETLMAPSWEDSSWQREQDTRSATRIRMT